MAAQRSQRGRIMGVAQLDLPAIFDAIKSKGLKHYGIKGMKWGVRKKGGPTTTSVAAGPNTRRTKVALSDTDKASARSVSDDAARAAKSQAKIVSTSSNPSKRSTSSLSNKELQDLVTRMNLEQQYARLSNDQKSAGQKFVAQLLGNAGKQQVSSIVNQQAAQAVGNYMGTGSVRKPRVKDPGPEKRQY